MRKKYRKELELLNKSLIEMGSMVEWSLDKSIKALDSKDRDLAKDVIKYDKKINSKEKDIEAISLDLILRQQPVAKDLREIFSILKLVTDLERIGDYAKDIAEIALEIVEENYIKEIIDIKFMLDIVLSMVSMSLDAFTSKNIDLAKKVIDLDNSVNSLFKNIKKDLSEIKIKNSLEGKQILSFIMIAKYLERIADHAENIGEWVIYSIRGKSVNIWE